MFENATTWQFQHADGALCGALLYEISDWPTVIDEAVQMFGGEGISQDTPLARMWTHVRTLRLADGPDAVHRRQVARWELAKHTQQKV